MGVVAWSPLGRGVLTGKYRTGTPADSRAASAHFTEFVSRSSTSGAATSSRLSSRPPAVWASLRWKSPWLGYATVRA